LTVEVRHIGHLGNNLFEYALGRIVAEHLGQALTCVPASDMPGFAPIEKQSGIVDRLQNHIEHFPHAGEIVLFDRSWYNRAMVEPVMGFCTERQYREFMSRVVDYEESFLSDQKTHLLKLYFSVSREEQERRFERRKNDPLRQWKLSEVDLQAQEHWDEFTMRKFRLLKKTHTKKTPWYVIRSDDKHLARFETMKIILRTVPYRGRSRTINYAPDPDIVIPGDLEIKVMEAQRRKTGKFLS